MPKKSARPGNLRGGSKLTAYECPCCHMLAWHKSETQENILCPFCCSGLPNYITKISPETMVATGKGALRKKNGGWPVNPARRHCPALVAEKEHQSPFVLEFHMVQGTGFRCMAYRNGDGKWHGAFDNEELPGAIRVLD